MTLYWQPAPDVASGAYRARVTLNPFTVGGHEIHDNFIHDQWDGIQTSGGPGENVSANIHHNRILDLSDDGLEPNGAE